MVSRELASLTVWSRRHAHGRGAVARATGVSILVVVDWRVASSRSPSLKEVAVPNFDQHAEPDAHGVTSEIAPEEAKA